FVGRLTPSLRRLSVILLRSRSRTVADRNANGDALEAPVPSGSAETGMLDTLSDVAPAFVPTCLGGADFLTGNTFGGGVFLATGAGAAFFATGFFLATGFAADFFAAAFFPATLVAGAFLAGTFFAAVFFAGALTSPCGCRRTTNPIAIACSNMGS